MRCPNCNQEMSKYEGLIKVEWDCANSYCGTSAGVYNPEDMLPEYEVPVASSWQLDNIAILNGIDRKIGETDDELRIRIKDTYSRGIL